MNKVLKRISAMIVTGVIGITAVGCGSSTVSSSSSAASVSSTKTAASDSQEVSEKAVSLSNDTGSDAETTSSLSDVKAGTVPVTSHDLTVTLGIQQYWDVPIILKEGWFDQVFAGKNIKIKEAKFNNGPEMIEAFTAGSIDFAEMGMQPGISGAANNAGISILGAFSDGSRNIQINTLKSSGIKTIQDLKGKKVGTTIGSSAYSLLLSALAKNGLSINDINFVNIDFSAAATALESGEVDAAVGYTPSFLQVEKTDGKLFYTIMDAEGYGVSEDILVANTKFAKEHPDVVENLLVLYDKANDFIEQHNKEAVSIIADYFGVPDSVMKQTLAQSDLHFQNNDTVTKDIDNYIQFMYDNGLITKRLNVGDVVDTSYADAVGIGK